VTEFDALDDEPLPATFRADTVNVYDTPLVSPATEQDNVVVVHV
jgi:hypothetical protein